MTCGTLACSRSKKAIERSEKRGESPHKEVEIAGTWDFKWPLRSKIRIAFQLGPKADVGERAIEDRDYLEGIRIVTSYIDEWKHVLQQHEIQLELQVQETHFEAPLGVTNSATDQYRSPFLPEDPIAKPYDVLISLRDLPIPVVDPLASFGAMTEEIIFPSAELGAYNRRADFGTPSVYLGRFGRFVEDYPSLSKYLDTRLGKHIVMHELGHVLGLPHIDQSPLLPLRFATELGPKEIWLNRSRNEHYKPARAIRDVIEQELGVEPSLRLIQAHLIDPWPGNLSFSDWLLFNRLEAEAYLQTRVLPSIMAFPFHSRIVNGGGPEPSVDWYRGHAEGKDGPQEIDILHLRYMYDPNFANGTGNGTRIVDDTVRVKIDPLFESDASAPPPPSLAAEDLRSTYTAK